MVDELVSDQIRWLGGWAGGTALPSSRREGQEMVGKVGRAAMERCWSEGGWDRRKEENASVRELGMAGSE